MFDAIFVSTYRKGGKAMMNSTPLYISPKGGSITCFRGDTGRIFRSCSRNNCVYSSDLHSAKAYLDNLEGRNNLLIEESNKSTEHRKTTLKWNLNGELSAVDMARILDAIANPRLTECEFACQVKC